MQKDQSIILWDPRKLIWRKNRKKEKEKTSETPNNMVYMWLPLPLLQETRLLKEKLTISWFACNEYTKKDIMMVTREVEVKVAREKKTKTIKFLAFMWNNTASLEK